MNDLTRTLLDIAKPLCQQPTLEWMRADPVLIAELTKYDRHVPDSVLLLAKKP